MPGKTKEPEDKVKIVKGQEAEDLILKYMREVNRPYGAIDITANLKGAVAKAQVLKILQTLVDRGELTQKVVGKSSFFVINQGNIPEIPKDQLSGLEEECKVTEGEVKILQTEAKQLQQELNKIKSSPNDEELKAINEEYKLKVEKLLETLEPLRTGTPLISASEVENLDQEWMKWRAEWIRRRNIAKEAWCMFTDSLPPQDATELAGELGVEVDSPEHVRLEKSPLCLVKMSGSLKRK